MSKKKHDYRFKVTIIGSLAAGKTTLTNVIAGKEFSHNYIATIGVEYVSTERTIFGKKICLDLWDVAGSERFHSITKACARGSRGIIIVYDLNDNTSLKNSIDQYDKIYNDHEGAQVILVGTKNDLETKVSETELNEVCDDLKIPSFKTSAKTKENLEAIFQFLVSQMMDNHNKLVPIENTVVLEPEHKKKDSCCSS
ncbi:MAG: GTP-binding protein ypt1 [Edafosvirus sp.]|uniref:GTP-binding protein ypt1 n=1 Tax=Edafosvirus sp. TaxID=2487765 RepID=A0A3G4ZV93_9VIRU|nr:MAG: GTP-binding protein ypt1 [Edafosvirus sp.]